MRQFARTGVEAARKRATLGEISGDGSRVRALRTQPTPVKGVYGPAYADDKAG
jgi:hypothetical protein